ncbi:MAG TPA: DUF4097 family beta strand repeat-containing protein [Pyrinomonadaceae bacterium]
MRPRAIKTIATLLVAAAAFAPLCVSRVRAAQQQQPPPQQSQTGVVAVPPAGAAGAERASRVSAKLERGGRVAVDNFTTGRIRVTGWDKDTVEATATSERGDEAVTIRIDDTAGGRRVVLDTSYADDDRYKPAGDLNLEKKIGKTVDDRLLQRVVRPDLADELSAPSAKARAPRPTVSDKAGAEPRKGEADPTSQADAVKPKPTPAPEVVKPPDDEGAFIRRPREIHIEVRVPRYAELELIRVFRSPVEVSDIDTTVVIVGERGEVRLKGVGAAEVRTRSGRVEVEDVRGVADIFTVGGPIAVRRTPGDVLARTIDGRIELACVGGRVDVTNTDGFTSLAGIGGDVEANTTSGDIAFAGALRAEGRYELRSITGRVEAAIAAAGGAGFNASLSSYRGSVSTDFELKLREDTSRDPVNRRLVGRHGDGRAQLTLDSFEGAVRLAKAPPDAAKLCR